MMTMRIYGVLILICISCKPIHKDKYEGSQLNTSAQPAKCASPGLALFVDIGTNSTKIHARKIDGATISGENCNLSVGKITTNWDEIPRNEDTRDAYFTPLAQAIMDSISACEATGDAVVYRGVGTEGLRKVNEIKSNFLPEMRENVPRILRRILKEMGDDTVLCPVREGFDVIAQELEGDLGSRAALASQAVVDKTEELSGRKIATWETGGGSTQIRVYEIDSSSDPQISNSLDCGIGSNIFLENIGRSANDLEQSFTTEIPNSLDWRCGDLLSPPAGLLSDISLLIGMGNIWKFQLAPNISGSANTLTLNRYFNTYTGDRAHFAEMLKTKDIDSSLFNKQQWYSNLLLMNLINVSLGTRVGEEVDILVSGKNYVDYYFDSLENFSL